MKLHFEVSGDDLSLAGKASAEVKRALGRLGVDPGAIKRTAVSMYEAEMNMVIHGGGGVADIELSPERVVVTMEDAGPGIPDLEQAMREGFSTAPEWIREMGFGAGMGLPNIKRNSDDLHIDSTVGKGTKVTIVINFGSPGSGQA